MVPIVAQSRSMSQVLKLLGLRQAGGNYKHVGRHIIRLGLNTNHFKRKGWSKGLTKENCSSIGRVAAANSVPDSEVFQKDSTFSSSRLKNRLVKLGWVYECAVCGLMEWQGKEIRLHVDHKDGDHYNNQLQNLRFLCPNCHSQTATYCGRNLKGRSTQLKKEKAPRTTNPARKTRATLAYCKACDQPISSTATYCKPCFPKPEKIIWPEDITLLKMISKTNRSAVSRKLGVSETAVRKRLKRRKEPETIEDQIFKWA